MNLWTKQSSSLKPNHLLNWDKFPFVCCSREKSAALQQLVSSLLTSTLLIVRLFRKMSWQSILRRNLSFVIRAGSRLVVVYISHSQPVLCVKLVKHWPLLPDSSTALNIFLPPPVRSRSLLLRHDREIHTYPNKELDHRRLWEARVITSQSLSVSEYFNMYPTYSCVRRFRRTQANEDNL